MDAIRSANNSEIRLSRTFLGWFTLAELIVVVTILAILATVGFVSLSGYASDARNSTRVADVNSLVKVAELAIVTQGKYPDPANAVAVTGWVLWNTIFKQWFANSSVFHDLSWKFGSSANSGAYVYSTLSDGSAYQVAAEYEWTPPYAYSTNTAYAASKSAYVQGSYLPNPAMPSIIVVPWSVPSSGSGGLWSPNVCFVTNGGTNVPASASDSCMKRAALDFGKSDTNLIAYYDMETYYQASYSGTANTLFLKDMSGNGYDMQGKIGSPSSWTIITSTTAPGGNVFDSASNDTGVKFMSGTYQMGFWTVDADYEGTTPYAKAVPRSQFFTEITSSWSKVIPGMSFESRVSYDRASAAAWGIKRVITWALSNFGSIDAWDVYKTIDSSPLRMNGTSLHSYVVPYNTGTVGIPYGVNGYVGCNGICASEWSHNYYSTNTAFNGELLLNSVFDFTKRTNCTYVNGVRVSCTTLSQSTIARLQDAGYKKASLSISSINEPWSGTVRSATFYSRAMGDQEIAQHARVSGF